MLRVGLAILAVALGAGCVRRVAPIGAADTPSLDATIVFDGAPTRDSFDALVDSIDDRASQRSDAVDSHDTDDDAPIVIVPSHPSPLPESCIPVDALEDASLAGSGSEGTSPLDQSPVFAASECAWPVDAVITGSRGVSRRDPGGTPCPDSTDSRCLRHVYAFSIREPTVLTINGETSERPRFWLRRQCADPTTGVGLRHTSVGDIDRFRDETVLAPSGYYLVVDAVSYAQFLQLQFARPAPNYGCDTPTDVPLCAPIHAVPGVGRNEYFGGCDPPDSDTFERVLSYRVNVPPNSVLHVVGGNTWGCGTPYDTPYLGPFVAGGLITFGVRRQMSTMYLEAIPAAPNAWCRGAALLTPGESLRQLTATGTSRRGARPCVHLYTLYYVFDLAPFTAATLALGATAGVRVARNCEDLGTAIVPAWRTAYFVNDTPATTREVIAVDTEGARWIEPGLATRSRAHAVSNAFCSSPMLLVPGVPVTGQSFDRAYASCVPCGLLDHPPALYYSVHLEPHQVAHVLFSAPLFVHGPIVCDAIAAPQLSPENTTLTNDADVARDFEIAVSPEYWRGPPESFDVTLSLE